MTATMTTMEWRVVDTILVDTLEVGDNILMNGKVVEIVDLFEEREVLLVTYQDDYEELIVDVPLDYDDMVDIYMLFD